MSDDTCCICLSGLKNKTVKVYRVVTKHFQCFMELVMRKNLFIECLFVEMLIKIPNYHIMMLKKYN